MAKVERLNRPSMKPLIEPFGLCEAVKAHRMLYLGGQTGMDETHQIVGGGLKAQAVQAFRNIEAVLVLAGARRIWFTSPGMWSRAQTGSRSWKRPWTSPPPVRRSCLALSAPRRRCG